MKLSLATLLLITPCDGVKIKNKSLPAIPISGQDIVQGAIKGLDAVPIKELMHEVETHCRSDWDESVQRGSPEDDCETWDRGLYDEIKDVNRDLKREGERYEVDITDANLYDPQFIIEFVEAEYHDFVKEFKNHQDHIAQGIDYGLSQLQKELTALGLAQMKAKLLKKDGEREEGPDKWACYNVADQERREKEQACTDADRSAWPSVCNYNNYCGPRGCKEVDWSQCKDSWGPQCDERDMTADEEQVYRAYEHAEINRWEHALIGCYLESSPLAAQVADDMAQEGLTQEAFAAAFVEGANELTSFVNGEQIGALISEGINEINHMLEGESKRLGVAMTRDLPNPEDTSQKLVALIRASLGREIERHSLDNMALEIYRDIIQEAHNIEFDMQHSGDFNMDPERLQRDIQEGVNELGLEVDAGAVAGFVTEAVEDVKGLVNNEQFHSELKNQLRHGLDEAKHQLEHLKQ